MARAKVGESDDLATLSDLDEVTLLNELKARYQKNQIYTYVGDILLAVNPYKDIGIYTREISEKYKNAKRSNNQPHIFAVSDAAYQSMRTGNAVGGKKNQCIVISGESGAGKTESTKLIIKQLIELCKGKSQLEQQILQVNPLLEAFGNAQTVMNDNSSRFGKYIQLKFLDGKVKGAKISEYLLEKSRVTFQNPSEETFHIFYYMLGGLPSDTKAMLNLLPAEQYRYLKNGPGRLKADPEGTLSLYDELIDALNLVGFYEEEQEDMFTILSAVLWMGQIEIDTNENEEAFIKNMDAVQTTADLLGVDVESLKNMLTFVTSRARGEVFTRNYSKHQAYDVRDALTKALYGRLFSWIVNKINQLLAPEEELEANTISEIGILDIFGFEHLFVNSFEQMCINLANEQLQNFFNQHIFLLEQAEYQAEGVDWTRVPFVNNQPLLDLFLMKPIGVLALLDEESLFPQGSDHSLVEKMNANFAKNHHYLKAKVSTSNKFSIDHYAGRVEYDALGFLEKNRDTLPVGATQMYKLSSNDLISTIFTGTITRTGTLALQNRVNPKRKSRKSLKKMRGRDQTTKKVTVSAQFKNSLSVLMELLNKSNPHFVRCIKPNQNKKPDSFDDKLVTDQLRYTGMLETTRIRKEGFAVRPRFADFVKRYKVLALNPKLSENQYGCKKILEVSGVTGWMIGKTKVFLKYYHQDMLEAKIELMGKTAVHIQKIVRGFLARKKFSRIISKYRKEQETCNSFLLQLGRFSLSAQQSLFMLQQKDKHLPQAFFDLMAKSSGTIVVFDANNPPLPETEPEPIEEPIRSPPPPPVIEEPKDLETGTPNQNAALFEERDEEEDLVADDEDEDEDEEDDEDEEEDVVEEDVFVKEKKTIQNLERDDKYEASKRWFQETQYHALKGNTGFFQTWFHGIITRRQAEELLWEKPQGSFLVRVSESRFGYSVSLRAERRCKHFAVDQMRNKRYVVVGEEKTFRSLNDLVKYYRLNDISPYGDKLMEAVGQMGDECDYEDLIKDLPPPPPPEPESAPKHQNNNVEAPKDDKTVSALPPPPASPLLLPTPRPPKLPSPPPAESDTYMYLSPKDELLQKSLQPPPLPPKTRSYYH